MLEAEVVVQVAGQVLLDAEEQRLAFFLRLRRLARGSGETAKLRLARYSLRGHDVPAYVDSSSRRYNRTKCAASCLLSTYELGRQPFGLASPAAWLRAGGVRRADVADLSRDAAERGRRWRRRGSSRSTCPCTPPRAWRCRSSTACARLNPGAHLCAYGLYAPAERRDLLRRHGVDTILGPEFEARSGRAWRGRSASDCPPSAGDRRRSPTQRASPRPRRTVRGCSSSRLIAAICRRSIATRRSAARRHPARGRATPRPAAAASTCAVTARSCPSTAATSASSPLDVVLADVARAGGRRARSTSRSAIPTSSTASTHARRLVDALRARVSRLSYDVTIKVEHLLEHARPAARAARHRLRSSSSRAVERSTTTCCERCDKGHTRADFEQAAAAMRDVGLPLAPTFVAFTPWTTLERLCRTCCRPSTTLGLVEHVAPIQLAHPAADPARLAPAGAAGRPRAASDRVRPGGARVPVAPSRRRASTTCSATSRRIVGRRTGRAAATCSTMRCRGDAAADPARPRGAAVPCAARARVPYLTEPWYC